MLDLIVVPLMSEAEGDRRARVAPGLGIGVGDGGAGGEAAHVAPPGIGLVKDVEDAGAKREPLAQPNEGGGVEDREIRARST